MHIGLRIHYPSFPHPCLCLPRSLGLDFGRFQATEGLFNPDAWGLDHPGLHKLVHKAVMVRKL